MNFKRELRCAVNGCQCQALAPGPLESRLHLLRSGSKRKRLNVDASAKRMWRLEVEIAIQITESRARLLINLAEYYRRLSVGFIFLRSLFRPLSL